MPRLGHYTRAFIFGGRQALIHVQLNRQVGVEPAHDHEFIEIVLVHQGHAIHESAAGTSRIGPGTVIILHPAAWHSYRDCQNFKIYNCCFGIELLNNELAWLIEDPILGALLWGGGLHERRGGVVLKLQPGTERRCSKLAAELSSSLNSSSGISRAEATARLSVYLTALSANFALRKEHMDPTARAPHPAVMNCMRQIAADFDHPWSLAELARSSGVCREHLIRLFHQAIGTSPMAYLDRRRSERAAHLLEKSTLSIGEIGLQVGWGSPITLSRRYKAHFGISATEYRARTRSGRKNTALA